MSLRLQGIALPSLLTSQGMALQLQGIALLPFKKYKGGRAITVGVAEVKRDQASPPVTSQSMFHSGVAEDSDFQTREGKAHGGEPPSNLIGPGSVLVHERR